ncbi:2-C-methyl-D-erythritol 4-phosphate cytidylyltransferase [Advenella sp. RU8]|uniref:2-C-methyl-D-erythritol 4-phosphate cytidylyltransferase n=1 Tax=Advenella sp. RU8 TaxID=3399575 RepID=UPI003AB01EC2
MSEKIIALIPAGGIGARAHGDGHVGPKQYRVINGVPMLVHTVKALLSHAGICKVHIGVAPNDAYIADCVMPEFEQVCIHRSGGASRADTVLNTLLASQAADSDWVLVHDAARPGLQSESLNRLIQTCLFHDQGGILATPVPDTVKRAVVKNGLEVVETTVPREGLWLAQTPQMFRVGLLRDALLKAREQGFEVTDEASAMEFAGFSPMLVRGSIQNMKVTWPGDFEIMAHWL